MNNTFRDVRKQRYATQSEFARQSGFAQNTISQYELQLRTPNLKNMQKLADALNVDLQTIVDCFATKKDQD